jgi:hypothetical protein
MWRRVGTGVQWLVEIESLPFGHRLGVSIGLDLQTGTTPTRPNFCPIYLDLETMHLADDVWVTRALDMDARLTDDERRHDLESAARSLSAFIGQRLSLDSVRAAYRDGDFKSGFIHKDVRHILEL